MPQGQPLSTSITEHGRDSQLFEAFARSMLERGLSVRFEARGCSMSPTIRDGEIVEVKPVTLSELQEDDIVLAKSDCGFRLHRLVMIDRESECYITRGDSCQENDPPINRAQILGLARAKEVRLGWTTVRASFRRGRLLRSAARAQYLLVKIVHKVAARRIAAQTTESHGSLNV